MNTSSISGQGEKRKLLVYVRLLPTIYRVFFRWLNQQKEKQRIIWGYKILFLDVMFPLDVKKILFVDTDQIVR